MSQLRVLILGVIVSVNAWGGKVERYDYTSKVYTPNSKDSEISKFELKSYNYKVYLDTSVSYGSGMYAGFETKNLEILGDYGVVQFIRGCHFDSKLIGGRVEKTLTRARKFFDETINFKHPQWVVDSNDKDPMYGSNEGYRFWNYRWNSIIGNFDDDSSNYVMNKAPETPFLYISDFPGTAFAFESNEATNISLQFKTCLFRISDIPIVATPEGFSWDGAIACHDWNSSFIYNHTTKEYESKKSIDSFCLE